VELIMPSISETERQDALRLMASANQSMAERVQPPARYHLALGLMVGGVVALREGPLLWTLAALPLYGVGLMMLVRVKRDRMGMFVNGYRRGRTRWVAIGALTLFLSIMLLAAYAEIELRIWGAYLIAGAAIAAIFTVAGPLWLRAYRRDLGEA
jgi:hypothetical protein